MPRMIEIKTGNNLTIAGPARVIVYGSPTLTPPTTFAAPQVQASAPAPAPKPHGGSQHSPMPRRSPNALLADGSTCEALA